MKLDELHEGDHVGYLHGGPRVDGLTAADGTALNPFTVVERALVMNLRPVTIRYFDGCGWVPVKVESAERELIPLPRGPNPAVKFEIVRGNFGSGLAIYINDFRAVGSKPWGGGSSVRLWFIERSEWDLILQEAGLNGVGR